MSSRLVALVGLALLAAGLALPAASGSHCESKLHVFGRVSLAPTSPPPYSSTPSYCPKLGGHEHTLPPQSDQLFVRVHGDFGKSVPSVLVSLDGLGFSGQLFTLNRTANPLGGSSYQMREWVNLPLGPQVGELTATAYFPQDVVVTATYRSIA